MRVSLSRRGTERGFRRSAGALESEILTVLWTAGAPLTAAEVQRELGDGLAHTTVVTILSRLHAKGVLTRARQGRAHAYAPVADEAGLAARRMFQVLDARADREVVLSRFVSDLSASDEEVLRRLLGSETGPDAGAGTVPPAGPGPVPEHRPESNPDGGAAGR